MIRNSKAGVHKAGVSVQFLLIFFRRWNHRTMEALVQFLEPLDGQALRDVTEDDLELMDGP